MYTPDNWIIFYTKELDLYKILAGWSGGYLGGDAWRINSGIVSIEEKGDHYLIYGNSGSCYKCYKDRYKLRPNNGYIWERINNELGNKVKMIPADTNFLELKFN